MSVKCNGTTRYYRVIPFHCFLLSLMFHLLCIVCLTIVSCCFFFSFFFFFFFFSLFRFTSHHRNHRHRHRINTPASSTKPIKLRTSGMRAPKSQSQSIFGSAVRGVTFRQLFSDGRYAEGRALRRDQRQVCLQAEQAGGSERRNFQSAVFSGRIIEEFSKLKSRKKIF